MLTIKQVAAKFEVTHVEIRTWIELQWVLPAEQDGAYLFDEVDLARIKLINELRRDLEVNDAAVPVVLRLIDQVHGLHRAIGDLHEAIEALSVEARQELESRLREITEP
jgi:chaperone modulatory protein CbpM